jgi:two-component system, chemotaxis family, chemotaxis protein CheY
MPTTPGDLKNVKKGGADPMSLRILVVDDSKTTRRVLSALVSSRWTVCGQAENGRSALKKFRELKPDLVLLDLAMPDMDGIEVGRQMHAIDAFVPLILFTLLDPWGLEAPARKAGIWRVVSKSEGWKLIESIEQIVSEFEGLGKKARLSKVPGDNPKSKAAGRS